MDPADHFERMAARVAAGHLDAEVAQWLTKGFATWARAGGAFGLERALGLLSTEGQRRRRQRNGWLVEVARQLGTQAPGVSASRAVHDALQRFVTRGPWSAWRDLSQPPEGVSRLYLSLHQVARASNGRVLSVRRIEQLLPAEILSEKFRPAPETMQAERASTGAPNGTV